MAGLYNALGILLDSKVQEKTRGDIVAPFVGQTTIKVKQLLMIIRSVLFIDEVYSIAGCPDPDTKQFDSYGENHNRNCCFYVKLYGFIICDCGWLLSSSCRLFL